MKRARGSAGISQIYKEVEEMSLQDKVGQQTGGSAGNNNNDNELYETDWAEKARHRASGKVRPPRFPTRMPAQGCDENAMSQWVVVRLGPMQVIHSSALV
jgi:hypothetical protein